MPDLFTIPLSKNKIYLLALLIFFILTLGAYYVGVKDGFIPPEIQCKDTLMIVDQCKIDKADQQKTCTSDLIKCNAECKIDTCDKICSDKVRDALNNYKILLTDIKCGSIK
jgi:hypothetical protein